MTTTDHAIGTGEVWSKYCKYLPGETPCVLDDTHGTDFPVGQLIISDEGKTTWRFGSKDAVGNFAYIDINIWIDTIKPVINLNGLASETIDQGKIFTDRGATVSDLADSNIHGTTIYGTGSVNTAVVGTYTLTYNVTDAAGNTADTVTRTVNVVAPVAVAINPPTTPVQVNPGTVLGAATPVISTPKASKSKFTLVKLDGTTVKIQPFEKTYKGGVWARRVNFGSELGSVYLFAPTDKYNKGAIKVYGPNGTLLKTIKPYGGFSKYGFNLSIVVETLNDNVYLALGTKKAGTTVKVYQVQSTGLTLISSLKAGNTAGNVMVRFMKLYSTQYGLATAVNGKGIKVYKYSAKTNKFVQDKSYNLKKLKFSNGTINKK